MRHFVLAVLVKFVKERQCSNLEVAAALGPPRLEQPAVARRRGRPRLTGGHADMLLTVNGHGHLVMLSTITL